MSPTICELPATGTSGRINEEQFEAILAETGRRLPGDLWASSLRRVTVSREFWEIVQRELPILNTQRGYRELFWYLLFSSRQDEDTKRILLPHDLLCSFEGRRPHHSRTEALLISFREDVILPLDGGLRWSGYDPGRNKCRQVIELHWGRLQRLIDAELNKEWHHEGRVYLDGRSFSKATIRQARREELKEVQDLTADQPEVEEARTYLNSQPPHPFTQCVESRNFEKAWRAAHSLKNPAERKAALLTLRCIKAQPQPYYRPSSKGNTVRLFTPPSIATLRREIRKLLTAGWPEVDIRCSQLAIVAALWGVDLINDFLRSGENFWAYLLHSIGAPQSEWARAKEVLKPSVYSVCFGKKLCRILGTTERGLEEAGLNTGYAARFLKNPLMQALLEAREGALRSIEEEGGATTCFGKLCPVTPDRQPKHVMAEVAQALEMKMILPVFKLAQETRDFTIVLFQHDGFSLHFWRRSESWEKRIKEALQEEIANQGVQTTLEWEWRGEEEDSLQA